MIHYGEVGRLVFHLVTASRYRHIPYALVFLGAGCVSPSKYERVDVTLERIALRDAWLQTAVPFGLAFCLVLLLVLLYYRRNAPDALDALFRPRRAPDVVGAVRAWWRNREDVAPYEALLRLVQHRARVAERAQWREADRLASLEAERVERESIRRAEAARRARPPLGPPRLGFLSRFMIGLVTGILLTMVVVMPFAYDKSDWGGYVVVIGAVVGFPFAFVASLVCAILVSALERKTIGRAMICGASVAVVGSVAVPPLWFLGAVIPIAMLCGGSAIGFAIGVADELSRKPQRLGDLVQ